MNKNISISPFVPNALKFTAQGYIKITSTSNKTNKIATKKYFTENGTRAFPEDSIPHSNESNFLLDFLLGPKKCVATMVVTTKPSATPS